MSHWNGLTDAEDERLAIHGEECGENNKVLGKIYRHGYRAYNPFKPELGNNRENLIDEAGDVIISSLLLIMAGDLPLDAIEERMRDKLGKMTAWIHCPENIELINRLYAQLFGAEGSGGIRCLFPTPPVPRSHEDFPPPHFGSLSGSISSQRPS